MSTVKKKVRPKSKAKAAPSANAPVKKGKPKTDAGGFGGVEQVLHRNEYYRDGYRKLLGAILFLAVGVIISGVSAFWAITHVPEPKYFATTNTGELIPLVPLSKPNISNTVITQWTADALRAIHTFDFANYRDQLQSAGNQYFTKDGFKTFMDAMESSGNLAAVLEKKLVVSAIVTGTPIIHKSGRVGKVYAWKIEAPLQITYQSGAETTQPQSMIAELVVVRTSTLSYDKGVAINKIIVRDAR